MGAGGRISTVIIGSEADFRSLKRISREESEKLIRSLKDHVNLSYENEATIAAEIGVGEDQLNGWLSGRIKPRVQSLFKVRAFLNRQPTYRYPAITRMGGEGSELVDRLVIC
jgi:transcriptional regulator with XRE-family HTH domain